MRKRVVITGLGVVSPNGVGVPAFAESLRLGRSGLTHQPELAALGFSCQVAGIPPVTDDIKRRYFTDLQLRGLNSSGIEYGVIAGCEAWQHAGLPYAADEPDWQSGIIFGVGSLGVDKFREAIYKIDEGQVRKLGSTTVVQTMASGISAYLGGMLGCGNLTTTNSSACATGTEAVLMAYERIANGHATRMLAGSTGDSGPYVWGGFEAMRILPTQYNHAPEQASRPMSATAAGLVPSSGAGALVLESLESAEQRGAIMYAEVLGGCVNAGGQRQGGTLTAPNPNAVENCIRQALANANVAAQEIDLIDGHLTATAKDPDEIRAWSRALGRIGSHFPYIHSLKGLIGHGLSAAGSLECVATVLGLHGGFIYPNLNADDLHPAIAALIDPARVPTQTRTPAAQTAHVQVVAKANFGFGDVNACVLFRKFQ